MGTITLTRTDRQIPTIDAVLEHVRGFLFGVLTGLSSDDRRAWGRFWGRVKKMQPGEIVTLTVVQPRSGPFHRRHMALEAAVFDAQERFSDFEQFRVWLKVGAGWVDWCAGPKGGVVPIPKSISYAAIDQDEFEAFHERTVAFLRGPHAAPYLWKHLGENGAAEMMETILTGFSE